MSKEGGEKKGLWHHRRHHRHVIRGCVSCLCGLVITVLFIVLILYLVLRPTKPMFFLKDVQLKQLVMTGPNAITVVLQVTMGSRNPNNRISIYYDKLDVYATYRDQQVTVATTLPPSFQDHKEVTVWSPFLVGNNVPMAPILSGVLQQDRDAGFVLMRIKIEGRIRWKVGTWISSDYRLFVNCPAFFTTQGGPVISDNLQMPPYNIQLTGCNVDVAL